MVVNIIVPVYNVEKYLSACLDSIVNQTYKHLHIILIDDGSTDNSGHICDEYANKDNRIEVIHTKNQGVSSARNLGIDKAYGEYVSFIDSDDTVQSNYIEELVSHTKSEFDYDLIMCNFKLIFSNITIDKSYSNENIFSGEFTYDYQYLYSIMSYPCGKLYKLQIIKENKINFPTDFTDAEDQMFNFKYCRYVKKYYLVNKPLYNYLQRDNSASKKASLKSFKCNLMKLSCELEFYKLMNIENYHELITNSCLSIAKKYVVLEDGHNSFFDYRRRIKDARKIIQKELNQVQIYHISKRDIAIMLLKNNMYFSLWLYYRIRKHF